MPTQGKCLQTMGIYLVGQPNFLLGFMAEKDVKLSSIVRALKEGITPKKVEDRLSRMLSSKGLERDLHDAIAEEGARMSLK